MPATSQRPKVSIGIPVYNGSALAPRAIESVLNQSMSDLELIISDNCSTDDTPEICQAYARQDDRVVYTKTDRNRGAAANFSRLPTLARGDFFKWVTHDDVIDEKFLEHVLPVAEERQDIITVATSLSVATQSGVGVSSLSAYVHHGPWSDDRLEQYGQMMDELAYCERYGGYIMVMYMYGLHRLPRLLQTRLVMPFISSDHILAAELALWGRLEKLDVQLNTFSLSESENSTTANFVNWNPLAIQRMLAPDHTSRLAVEVSIRRRHVEQCRAVLRGPLHGVRKLHALEASTRPFRAGFGGRMQRLRARVP